MIFILVHGSFHGGWCWKHVAGLLRNGGHDVYTPSLTGLGERAHLLARGVDLETHIADVLGLVSSEDLNDVVLVGHSAAGMIVDAVADRCPERVRALIYLDGTPAEDGRSFFDIMAIHQPEVVKAAREFINRVGDGWRVSPLSAAAFGIRDPMMQQWVEERLRPQSLATFEQAVTIRGSGARVPRAYIACTDPVYSPMSVAAAEHAKLCRWKYREIHTCHDAMLTAPAELAITIESVLRELKEHQDC